MTYDIRNEKYTTPNEIRFAEGYGETASILRNGSDCYVEIATNDDSESVVVHVEDIEYLIKALRKVEEFGWKHE